MPIKQITDFTSDELNDCIESLNEAISRLRLIVDKMQGDDAEVLGIATAKDFLRGIEKVANFTRAAEGSWRAHELTELRKKAGIGKGEDIR